MKILGDIVIGILSAISIIWVIDRLALLNKKPGIPRWLDISNGIVFFVGATVSLTHFGYAFEAIVTTDSVVTGAIIYVISAVLAAVMMFGPALDTDLDLLAMVLFVLGCLTSAIVFSRWIETFELGKAAHFWTSLAIILVTWIILFIAGRWFDNSEDALIGVFITAVGGISLLISGALMYRWAGLVLDLGFLNPYVITFVGAITFIAGGIGAVRVVLGEAEPSHPGP
jgi:hypothetical protein